MIYFIGDGILDNFYYLENKDQDLRKEIISLGFEVNNYAVDNIKLADIINGIIPVEKFKSSRKYQYHITKDGKLYPLQELIKATSPTKVFASVYNNINTLNKRLTTDNMTVISIGGCDVNERLFNVVLGIDYFINAIITPEFIENYEKIIETIKVNCKKIIIVSMYLPYLGDNSTYYKYASVAISIMDKWHEFLYKFAQKHNIPVLDLSRTLNSKDRSHYGTDDTRTSNISSKCIAKCITHIYNNYSGHRIYYSPNCNTNKIMID